MITLLHVQNATIGISCYNKALFTLSEQTITRECTISSEIHMARKVLGELSSLLGREI